MIAGSLAVRSAVIALLRGAAPVTAIVGQRIYASAPDKRPEPLVTLGPSQELGFGRAEDGGTSVWLQVDCWAQARKEASDQIAVCGALLGAVSGALNLSKPTISGWRLFGQIIVKRTQLISEPDGVSAHGFVTIRADLAPA